MARFNLVGTEHVYLFSVNYAWKLKLISSAGRFVIINLIIFLFKLFNYVYLFAIS